MPRPLASVVPRLLVVLAGATVVLALLLLSGGRSALAQDSDCESQSYDDAVITDCSDDGDDSDADDDSNGNGDDIDSVEFTITSDERGQRRGGNDIEVEEETSLGEEDASEGEEEAAASGDATDGDDPEGDSNAAADDLESRSDDDKTREPDGDEVSGEGDATDSASGSGNFRTTTPRNYWSLAAGIGALFLFGIVFFIASRRTNSKPLIGDPPTSDDDQRTQE